MTICLQKYYGQDWFDEWQVVNQNLIHLCLTHHDVVVVPFCTLQNLKAIDVETHSEKLQDMIDWKIIDWAMDAVWDRSWNCSISSNYGGDEIAEHDANRKVASGYFWIHEKLWKYAEGSTANMLHLTFLSKWLVHGYSEFEKQILQIINIYLEIIQTYDPEMALLEEMHGALVCLDHMQNHCTTRKIWKIEIVGTWSQAVITPSFTTNCKSPTPLVD